MGDYGIGENLFDRVFADLGFDIFGHRGRKGEKTTQKPDLALTLEISLEEAASGCEKPITFHQYSICSQCRGTGSKDNRKTPCPDCKGTGRHISTSGHMRIIETCPRCRGEGQLILEPCPMCHGEGRIPSTQQLTVTIPPGVDTGTQVRIKRGNTTLYILINIQPHPLFTRAADDLIFAQSIPLAAAVLGGEVRVPLLTGSATMKIPAGTQNGTLFRLKGKGMPRLQRSGSGDLLVKITVAIPDHLTPEQKHLMEEFAKAIGNNSSPH